MPSGARVWLTGTAVDGEVDATDAYTRRQGAARGRALAAAIEQGEVGLAASLLRLRRGTPPPGLVDLAHRRPRARRDRCTCAARTRRHDFVHASDVGRAVVAAVAHDLAGEVQIGSGRLHTVADLVARARRRLVGRRGPGQHPPPAHSGETADITRLTALGWAPTRTEEFFTHG